MYETKKQREIDRYAKNNNQNLFISNIKFSHRFPLNVYGVATRKNVCIVQTT